MLRLGKEAAFILARTLNVAELEAPLVEEKAESRPKTKQAEPKKADVKKT